MSVFCIIFINSFIISFDHAAIGNKKSGDESDGYYKKKEDNKILTKVFPEFSGETFIQWIFHCLQPPLPVEFLCTDLMIVQIIFSYHTVTNPDNAVCHIFDRIVVRYHYNCIAVFLIDCFNQLQYFF